MIVTFLENEISDSLQVNAIAQHSGALNFLNDPDEDTYTDDDLKTKLK